MNPFDRPAHHRITIAGHLDDDWAGWFTGMALERATAPDGERITILVGDVSDQAALRGLLTQIWDLGLVILAVSRAPASHPSEEAPAQGEERKVR